MNYRQLFWSKILAEAQSQEKLAREKETEKVISWMAKEAVANPKIQFQIRSDPKGVAQRATQELGIPVNKRLVEVAEKELSAAVPGFDEARVQEMVFTTIVDLRTSFRMTLDLSRWLFIAGLCLVIISLLAGIFGVNDLSIGVSGGAGALSLLLSAVMNPLDRIRNAAGNLVQFQAAYLAFYKQLYMLGGHIDALSGKEVIAYAGEIRKAAGDLSRNIIGALDKTRTSAVKSDTTMTEYRKTKATPSGTEDAAEQKRGGTHE